MKSIKAFVAVFAGFILLTFAPSAMAQELTITSFQNGYVSWNNVDSNLYYTVEYKPNLTTNLAWDGSHHVSQDVKSTNAIITVPVGMFYRVVGSASPMHASGGNTYTSVIRLPGSLNFGNCLTGAAVAASLTIYNDGDCAMTVTGIQYSDASFSGNWSGKVLGGSSTNITVSFAPVLLQSYNGTITVNCDKTSGTDTTACTGTGTFVRYVDNNDGTVTDQATGLMWMQNAGSGPMMWSNAVVYCSNLVFAGYSDWRLPSVAHDGGKAELDTLFRANGNPSGAWEGYAGTPFTSIQNNAYWSGTSDANNADYAWGVFMFNGYVYSGYKTSGYFRYVWPVRGGQ